VQALVGLAALAGIFVAWQQLQTDRDQARTDRGQLTEQLTLTRQGLEAERFTRAVDQLGSDKLEQRLGGIYGLERVAEESTSIRRQVFEVLTAFVRQHAPRVTNAGESTVLADMSACAPDVHAVVVVLGRRTAKTSDPLLDLHATDLRRADLSDAQLQKANLRGAQLQGATLIETQLQKADLGDAQLQGANLRRALLEDAELGSALLEDASLIGARLERANLFRAEAQSADLLDAQLQRANLFGAQLQRAKLSRAQLQSATLVDAQLQRANLLGAQLQAADLGGAQLQGANLSGAQLQGANLRDAQLQGALESTGTVWPAGFEPKAAGVRRTS
jgi:uncharacterized protein YjbI with pentapeptide repeats